MNLNRLYHNRFSVEETARKKLIWKVLNNFFFRKYIHENDVVLDIAAGDCLFINSVTVAEDINTHPKKRIAIDCNPEINHAADEGVTVYCQDATNLSVIPDGSVNVVFISNFLEHLPREAIRRVLIECNRILIKGGTVLILQPNYRLAYKYYFDFFDHITPISDRSLAEAIYEVSNDFKITRMIPAFLPYTTKSRLPQAPWMVRLYLCFPLAWRFLGKQLFCVVKKA